MDKSTTTLAHAAQQIGFQEYLHSVTESGARIARLEQALRDTLPEWSLRPLVQTLQALRGVQLIASMTLVAELQDFLRFENPRQLMAYVGLVPGEHSSGPKRRQGSISELAGFVWAIGREVQTSGWQGVNGGVLMNVAELAFKARTTVLPCAGGTSAFARLVHGRPLWPRATKLEPCTG